LAKKIDTIFLRIQYTAPIINNFYDIGNPINQSDSGEAEVPRLNRFGFLLLSEMLNDNILFYIFSESSSKKILCREKNF